MSKCHPSIDKQIEGVGGREGMKSQSWDLIEDKTSSRSRYVFKPPSSTGNTGSLPYANKTNKLRKIEYIVVKAKTNNLTGWFCFKIAVFCYLWNYKWSRWARLLLLVGQCQSTSHSTLFHCLHGWLHTLGVWYAIVLSTLSANRNKSIECFLQ